MKADLTQIEAKILVILSDFTPRNQNQITDLIGENHKSSTGRVHVSRALKNLRPFLSQYLPGVNEMGKIWVLRRDIDTLRQIGKKYPSIISDLQKTHSVVEIITNSVLGDELVQDLTHPLNLSGHVDYSDIIEMFTLSPSFFELWLYNEKEIVFKQYEELYSSDNGFNEVNGTQKRQTWAKEQFIKNNRYSALEYIFKHCIRTDALNNRSNPEAMDYLKQKSNEDTTKSKKQVENLLETHDDKLALMPSNEREDFFNKRKDYLNEIGAYNWLNDKNKSS